MFKDDLVKVLNVIHLVDPQNITFPLIYDKEFEQYSISEMDLSTRSENALRRNKIHSMGDLINNMDSLSKMRNCGRKSEVEIRNKFLETWYENISQEQSSEFWEKFVETNAVA